jgi:hypothetical protein
MFQLLARRLHKTGKLSLKLDEKTGGTSKIKIGRIDHDRLALGSLGPGQAFHHPDEDILVTPSLPAVVKRLRRAICARLQPIAC